MDWVTLLVVGLFAFAWLITLYQSLTGDRTVSQTAGMFVFLGAATAGTFYDTVLSTEAAFRPWIEPIAAVIMLTGLTIAWVWEPEKRNQTA